MAIETSISRLASDSRPASLRLKIATASVWVCPGMPPATTMVAPNSPSARAKPSRAAAITLRRASGRVMVANTRTAPAPSVAAIRSKRWSTWSKPARMVITMSGRLITTIASTTAFQVKTTSMPAPSSRRPSGRLRPSSCSSSSPIATGGSTSGNDTRVSTTALPRKAVRASSQPMASAIGSASSIASAAVAIENAAMPAKLWFMGRWARSAARPTDQRGRNRRRRTPRRPRPRAGSRGSAGPRPGAVPRPRRPGRRPAARRRAARCRAPAQPARCGRQ